MKILVTGAKGFVGRNLCAQLKNIRDGKARNYGFGPADQAAAGAGSPADAAQAGRDKCIEEVFEYDLDSTADELDRWCGEADFVFNLAGVNRPKDVKEFMSGNFGFASTLLFDARIQPAPLNLCEI